MSVDNKIHLFYFRDHELVEGRSVDGDLLDAIDAAMESNEGRRVEIRSPSGWRGELGDLNV